MMTSLKPPKDVAKNLPLTNFLQGGLVIWTKEPVLSHTKDKPGFLSCDVCGTDHQFIKQSRVLKHVTSKVHQDAAKKQLTSSTTERSKDLMKEHVRTYAGKLSKVLAYYLLLRSLTTHPNTFVDASEVVRAVQDFAVQYCAMKSLPFSAAEMALDCVSVAIATIFPEEADTKVINQLSVAKNKSHRQVSAMLRQINHLRSHVDIGGGDTQKRKSSGEKQAERTKRSRFRLHRTTVSKRVSKLGDNILIQKHKYLLTCPYIGLIIDEGNNFARSCPVYAAAISCDSEFNWRVQFIGQEDCEGRKNGEAVYKLVKKNFVDQGMLDVWNKICCVGTDGASVMRSIAKYSGACQLVRSHDEKHLCVC